MKLFGIQLNKLFILHLTYVISKTPKNSSNSIPIPFKFNRNLTLGDREFHVRAKDFLTQIPRGNQKTAGVFFSDPNKKANECLSQCYKISNQVALKNNNNNN